MVRWTVDARPPPGAVNDRRDNNFNGRVETHPKVQEKMAPARRAHVVPETSSKTGKSRQRRSRRRKEYSESESEEDVSSECYSSSKYDSDVVIEQVFMAKRGADDEGGSKKKKKTKSKRAPRVGKAADPEVAEMMRNMKVPLQLAVKHGVSLGVEMRKAVQKEYKARQTRRPKKKPDDTEMEEGEIPTEDMRDGCER